MSEINSSAHSRPIKLKALLFDVDGTMCHSDPFHQEAYYDMLKPFGIECDEKWFIANISGRANRVLRHSLVPHLDDEQAAAWFVEKEARFQAIARKAMEPLRGLLELIDRCHAHGVKVAAVTNAPKQTVEMMFEVFGLCPPNGLVSPAGVVGPKGRLDTVVLGDECAHSKPEPDAYILAMERLGVSPEECIVFEDSSSGVKAGVAAKCLTVGVMTSKAADELMSLGCNYCIDHYDDIDFDAMIHNMTGFVRQQTNQN